MKFGTGIDDDEQWLSKYINHFHFQVIPLCVIIIVIAYYIIILP